MKIIEIIAIKTSQTKLTHVLLRFLFLIQSAFEKLSMNSIEELEIQIVVSPSRWTKIFLIVFAVIMFVLLVFCFSVLEKQPNDGSIGSVATPISTPMIIMI